MDQRIVYSLDELPGTPHAVTIGSFDGVHCGHQYLLTRVVQTAQNLGIASLAITFDPLPAEVLRPDKAPPRLCTTQDRIDQMLACGIDRVLVLRFNLEMANKSAGEFLKEICQSAEPNAIIIGEDFAFGHNRQGTPQFLASRAESHGFALEVVERTNPDTEIEWSSSFLRRILVDDGDVSRAEAVLGRPFRLSGTVRDGDHRGRSLGYPTANLGLPDGLVIPADGIYAGLVDVSGLDAGQNRPALIYVGTRPTFQQTTRVIEVFLLEFDQNLYGHGISVTFLERIRGDRKFESPEQLVDQMKRDEAAGRRVFAERDLLLSANDR